MRGSWFETSPSKQFSRPISKITRAKWAGDVAHVVKCLLCKSKVLSSNSTPTKRKKSYRKKIKRIIWE
jgi:hypothetical protein